MRGLTAKLLALLVAVGASIPVAQATDIFTWPAGTFKLKAGGSRSSSELATIMPISTLGQNTVFTIPDPGGPTATFLLAGSSQTFTGNNTFTGTNTFPLAGIVLQGTSFNGTLKWLNAAGQASTITIPDPGAAAANVLLDQGVVSAVTIQHVAVPLTAAQLIAMYTTPVALIPAGVAGTNILVHKCMFTITTTSTAFTGGGVVAPQIGSTAHGAGTLTTATIAAAVVTAGAGTTYTTVIPVSYTGTPATGLYISNQTAAFAAGTGTAVVDLWYSIK